MSYQLIGVVCGTLAVWLFFSQLTAMPFFSFVAAVMTALLLWASALIVYWFVQSLFK